MKRQAQLLGLSRSSVYYRGWPVSARDLKLMRRIDELYLEARSSERARLPRNFGERVNLRAGGMYAP